MRKYRLLSGLIFGCLLLALATQVLPQGTGSGIFTYTYNPGTYIVIDAPGAGSGALQGTVALGIDTAGDVAGTCIDGNNTAHGWLFTASGAFTTFDAPGAGTGKNQGTFVTAIDTAGDITGYYADATEKHGFVRAASGTIASFDASPNDAGGWGTKALAIDAAGVVTGFTGLPDAFMRAADGTVTIIDVPGTLPNQIWPSEAFAINAAGVVTGRFSDASGTYHGFVRAANGTFTPFDPPLVATTWTGNGNVGTQPTSIDSAGDIAGTYTDTNGARHGFLRTVNGTITTFDAPGADAGPCATSGMGALICGTGGFAMDDAMDIVGVYVDDNNVSHGFLRSGATGAFTAFDAPGAGTGSYEGTAAFAINAAGTIAGTYVDANSVLHGFVGTPPPTPTATTLQASQNTTVFNEPASFTVTVSSSFGTPPNGETVHFSNGTTQLGSATLTDGVANFTTTAMPVGADSITAAYAGDTSFAGSTSAAVRQSVGKATSFTALSSSPNPSTAGQSVTFTATVSGQFGGTPTGSVTFSNGGTSLGTGTMSGASAVITTSALPAGPDSITAVYGSDTNFGASTSNAVSQVVMDFSVAASPASLTVNSGSSGTTTITVQDEGGFNSNVAFACSGLPTGAACSFSLLTVPTPAGISYTTLTVTTSATGAALHRNSIPLFPGSALAVALCCFGWKKRRRLQMLVLLAVSVAGLSLLTGCGGSSAPVQPVTSTITVTATSGSLSHSTTFSLTVN
jgi:hypothetical protein